MNSSKPTPWLIAREFPGRDSLIDRAYREHPVFRDLCRDYRTCADALEAWRRSDDEAASSRAREYADLLHRLGSEISSWLDAVKSGSTPYGRSGSQ